MWDLWDLGHSSPVHSAAAALVLGLGLGHAIKYNPSSWKQANIDDESFVLWDLGHSTPLHTTPNLDPLVFGDLKKFEIPAMDMFVFKIH